MPHREYVLLAAGMMLAIQFLFREGPETSVFLAVVATVPSSRQAESYTSGASG